MSSKSIKLTIGRELVTAVKKAAVSEKDTYELRITSRVVPESGKYLATLCTCNGSVQSAICIYVAATEMDETGLDFIFPATFSGTISTLAAFSNEDFKFDVADGICTVICGKAQLSVPLLESAVTIESANPKEQTFAKVTIEAQKLKKAVDIGASTMSTSEGKLAAVHNAIDFAPVTGPEGESIRIISVDSLGISAAGAMAVIKESVGLSEMLDKKVYALNSVFTRIVAGLSAEYVDIMLFDKQVILREWNDFYIIVPNAAPFPATISGALYSHVDESYSVKVEQKKLASALDIAMFGAVAVDERKTVLSISNGGLMVKAMKNGNNAQVECKDAMGDIIIGFDGTYLKKGIAHLGNRVTLSGTLASAPIYLKNDDPGVVVFIAPCSIDEGSSKE